MIGVHCAKFLGERALPMLRDAVAKHGIAHPVVNDVGFDVWQEYCVKAWPTVVLIDPRGYVVATRSGEVLAAEVAPLLRRLITEYDGEGLIERAARPSRPEAGSEPRSALRYPGKVLADGGGRLWVADTGQHRVLELMVEPAGTRELRSVGAGEPGFRDGPADRARFRDPRGMARSGATLYVADTGNHAVRAVDLGRGEVRTVAGSGEKAHGPVRPGPPGATPLRSPWDLAAPQEGLLLIAMAGSHQIWSLAGEERLGVMAGSGAEALVDGPFSEAGFNQPSGLAFGYGRLFVADAEASAVRMVVFAGEGRVRTLVGRGLFEFGDVDGVGEGVRLQHPTGIAVHDGSLYVADTYNHKVKRLDLATGEVATLIGTGEAGTRDGPFESAELNQPEGLSLDAAGVLYVADTNNHRVRRADLATGELITIWGPVA